MSDLLHNYVIKYKEIEGQMKRKKYNATVGDELPAGRGRLESRRTYDELTRRIADGEVRGEGF